MPRLHEHMYNQEGKRQAEVMHQEENCCKLTIITKRRREEMLFLAFFCNSEHCCVLVWAMTFWWGGPAERLWHGHATPSLIWQTAVRLWSALRRLFSRKLSWWFPYLLNRKHRNNCYLQTFAIINNSCVFAAHRGVLGVQMNSTTEPLKADAVPETDPIFISQVI